VHFIKLFQFTNFCDSDREKSQVRIHENLRVLWGGGGICESIGTAATPGLLCQLQVIVEMIVEKQMEFRLAGETKLLGENLPQLHFCPSQNPTWPDPGLNPGRRGGKPAANRLSARTLRLKFVPISFLTDIVLCETSIFRFNNKHGFEYLFSFSYSWTYNKWVND
jgi:hypothetical protein